MNEISKSPEFKDEVFLTYLGYQFIQFNTFEYAFAARKQLCEEFPNNPAHMFNFAYLMEMIGQYEDAIKYIFSS